MVTKGKLLNITPDNISEAQFMSANFVDNEIKKRAFINTLGAETAIEYLSGEGINTDNLRNMHSIKRVLEKVNIADIILPNIHIDVRVVFDEDQIFIPKSHFELGIAPNVYMVLKFNDNYENIEFLGYFEPKIINEENCNKDYYFVDKSQLKSGEGFADFVKNFVGNTEQNLSDSEFFKGRELSVLVSDEDITHDEFKQYLQMLKTNSSLRDSVLEYDNFETLSGSVAAYMHNSNAAANGGALPEAEAADDLSEPEELSASNMDVSQELDPNGEELINDDSFQNDFDMGTSDGSFGADISDFGVSDGAMELAGLAGDIGDSGFDAGMPDFSLDNQSENDSADVDLFGSIDTDSISDFPESEPSAIDTDSNADSVVNGETENAENGLVNLELSGDNLPDIDNSDAETAAVDDDLQEFPTEEIEHGLNDLSLDSDEDLLGGDIDLSADDIISMDGEDDEPAENVGIDLERLSSDSDEIKDDELDSAENMSDMSVYGSENTDVESFEQYNPTEPETGDIGISTDSNVQAAAVDFDDIEFEGDNGDINTVSASDTNSDNLYDLNSFSEITEGPINSEDDTYISESPNGDIGDFDNFSEIITEAPVHSQEEVFIEDNVLNNSPAIDNSAVISDKNFEPGEILLDINKTSLPDFGDDNIGDLYNGVEAENNPGLNNDVRVSNKNFASSSPSLRNSIIGLFLILAVAGTIIFSVMKMMNPKDDGTPVAGSLNPENSVDNAKINDDTGINPDNVVMNDEDNYVKTAPAPQRSFAANNPAAINQNSAPAQTNPSKPIPPTAFITVKKLSWEVPDYISYSPEFRQFFQSSGKSLKTALSSDLLLASDYAYSNMVKLSITFDRTGKFRDAKIVSSSGSSDVDKIVLQSVNQTLNILKAPNSLGNDENTTVILKIYL